MILLGSTGSIGKNTLEIVKKFNLEVEVLVAGNNYKLLNKQIKEFKPKYVVVKDKNIAEKIDFNNVLWGEEAILEVIERAESDLVVNALVGEVGLKPTLVAQKLNKKIALANKESLVIAGKFINTDKITPIDSEHFALWYLLQKRKDFNKLYITASGGALRDWDLKEIENATLEDVLKHPNWSMGVKITIDSATMVNKLFELLEAKWLFNTTKIDAFIETKSIIHALVEWIDGSTTAHLSRTDMKLPISFAILDNIENNILKPINLLEVKHLEFKEIDKNRYPLWDIKDLLLKRSDLGIVVNTANEFLIKKFINKEIKFSDISKYILKSVKKFENIRISSINDIFEIKKDILNYLNKSFSKIPFKI